MEADDHMAYNCFINPKSLSSIAVMSCWESVSSSREGGVLENEVIQGTGL